MIPGIIPAHWPKTRIVELLTVDGSTALSKSIVIFPSTGAVINWDDGETDTILNKISSGLIIIFTSSNISGGISPPLISTRRSLIVFSPSIRFATVMESGE